jgi:sugar diacid utilization regulator/GAF domain-containing protein
MSSLPLERKRSQAPASGLAPEDIAADLIGLLHRSASAEEFAARLSNVEALPDALRGKPGLVELVRMAMALRNRLELHEQRERGMLAVIESAQDLSSRLDLQGLLKAIANRARNLMGSHLCWLTVVDAHTGEFQVVVADGAISQRTGRMTAGRNLGVAGVVMSTRLPFFTPDYLHDKRFVHDPALDDTFRDEGVAALVGAPLICEDNVIGLLFVADRYHRTHTALNVSILCTLATHAAVAINNAKAFAEAKAALANADLARAELERHARDVQGAAEAHEQLTSLLARGASLGVLCESVAQLLNGSVLVLDEAGHVIASAKQPGYDGTAAQAYSPNGAHSADLSRALRESRQAGRSVAAFTHGDELCRAIAVIGGNDMLGAVLLFRHEDLRGISLRTFERSSSVIGVMLLSQERVEAEKSRDVSALLRTLISPRQGEPALAQDRAERFGLDLSQPMSLLVVETDQSTAGFWSRRLRSDPVLGEQVLDEVDGVLVLACNASRAHDVLGQFGAFARRELGQAYRGVTSRPALAPAELPALYAALRRGLSVLARLGMRAVVVAQNEMALYSVLFETHDQSSLSSFLGATIGPVTSHDSKRGSELTSTLLTYFDSNQNAKATASRMGIHVNTVRQRLASVEELLGHWGSASRALEIHMALRLWSLSAAGALPALRDE